MASWAVSGIVEADTSLVAVVGAIETQTAVDSLCWVAMAERVVALAIVAAAGPTDLADQVERPKVAVAGIEIDFLASSVVGHCLADIAT